MVVVLFPPPCRSNPDETKRSGKKNKENLKEAKETHETPKKSNKNPLDNDYPIVL
jgi:hypothetical protein